MTSEARIPEFTVLFEDDWCIAVVKPSGVLTQAPPGVDSLESRVRRYLQSQKSIEKQVYLGVPHRLDRPASGAMIFAKTRKAAQRLAEQFQRRLVKKVYWAVVAGKVDDAGHWIDFMRKIDGVPRAEIVTEQHPDAQRAELRFFKRSEMTGVSLLSVELITGRMHQIRLQAGSRGHPIVGDVLYGSRLSFGVQHADARCNAIALHARVLQLQHPGTKETMILEADVPAAWSGYMKENTFSSIPEKVVEGDGTHTTKAV